MRNHTGIPLRLAIAFASILAGMMALARTGQAQESYPSKPIQLVVTTAAGGALDLVTRAVAERLSESYASAGDHREPAGW